MKIAKRIFAFVLLFLLGAEIFAMPAFAMQMENEALEVTVVFDKDVYEEGEEITATIVVRNISEETVIITDVDQLVPEGYHLSEDIPENEDDILLDPDKTLELRVTYGEKIEGTEETAEDFFDKVIFGESFGIPNILIALAVIIAVALFFYFT